MLQKAREEVLARAAAEKRERALAERADGVLARVHSGLEAIAQLASPPRGAGTTTPQERLDWIRMSVAALQAAITRGPAQ